MDVASRRVLGFTLAERHDAQMAYGALAMALAVRGGQAPGVIFHTDQGRNTPAPSVRPASGSASASPWAGPDPRWITP
jgi:putative transposase